MIKLFILEPVQKLRNTIADVVYCIKNHHRVIHNTNVSKKSDIEKVKLDLQDLSARLISNQQNIPLTIIINTLFRLPDRVSILSASKYLDQLSLVMCSNEEGKYYLLDLYRLKICKYLKVQDPIDNGISEQELITEIKKIRSTSK